MFCGYREQGGDEHFGEPLLVLFGGPSPYADRQPVHLRVDQHGEAVGSLVSGQALPQVAAFEEMSSELFHAALPVL